MGGVVDSSEVAAAPDASPRIRLKVAFVFFAIALMTCLLVGFFLLARAQSERAAIEQQAAGRAITLSLAFDQEITAAKFLLKGLAKSPALISADSKAIYDQFRSTAIPDGTWLLFQDLEKQLVNSARAFGANLPQHTVYSNYRSLLNQIHDRGSTVSGRMVGPATGEVIVAVNLRIDAADGRMTNILTNVISERRLRVILNGEMLPSGWVKGLYDRELRPIVTAGDADTPAPSGLAVHLRDFVPSAQAEGTYEGTIAGVPSLVAFRRSEETDWTTIVQIPLAMVNAPLQTALWEIGGLAGFLVMAGGFAVFITARRFEQPLRALSERLKSSTHEISELSRQLLSLQEEERQRIARELHDSTAQHLVAANLALVSLAPEVETNDRARESLAQIESQLGQALTELRIFTYLLHPPDLAREGLQATLRDFIEGFAGRAGLTPTVRIPEEVDLICPQIQWSILRIVQEALANVHRHADASRVSITARVTAKRLVVRIRDDGNGMGGLSAVEAPIRFGVGIPGMRARLKQFGGDLRIRTGRGGTIVAANVPLATVVSGPTRRKGAWRHLPP